MDSAVQSIDVECNGKSVRENISALFIVVFYPRCTLPRLHSVFTVCKAHHWKSPSSTDTQIWLVNPQKPTLVKKTQWFSFLDIALEVVAESQWLGFTPQIQERHFKPKQRYFCKFSQKVAKVMLPGFMWDFQWIQCHELMDRQPLSLLLSLESLI